MIRSAGYNYGRVRPSPPMSNAERQRKFQAAHPGYDRRRKSRERASAKRGAEQIAAAMAEQLLTTAQVAAPVAVPAPVETFALPLPTWRLALPAPVECPDIAAIDEMRARLAAGREGAKVLPVAA